MAENSKNTRRPSNEVVVAAEYRLLNALIKKPEFRDDSRISVDLFSDVVAQSIFEAIYELADEKIEITPASLFQRGASIDFGVTESIINKVFSIDEDGASTLDDIIPPLLEAKDKYYLLNKLEDTFSSPELRYLYMGTANTYGSLISRYLRIAINVFKASSVQLQSINIFLYAGDSDPVRVIDMEHTHKNVYINDVVHVIDEIATHKTIYLEDYIGVMDKAYPNLK